MRQKSDTIYREAAIDLWVWGDTDMAAHSRVVHVEDIEALPSAQPELIRCKDCKHYYFAENRVPEEQSWVCDVWHVNQTAHMGYCFKAERRTDDCD